MKIFISPEELRRESNVGESDRDSKYIAYLEQHIQGVMDSFNMVATHPLSNTLLSEEDWKLLRSEVMDHDKSKYQDAEWEAYLNHFYPKDGSAPDNSVPDIEFDYAWNHHQKRNPHHWQYWLLTKDSGKVKPLDIPKRHIVHMLCDWHSFSAKNPSSTAKSWWEAHKDEMVLSEQTRQLIGQCIEFFDTPLS